jgi:hypothetical protein
VPLDIGLPGITNRGVRFILIQAGFTKGGRVPMKKPIESPPPGNYNIPSIFDKYAILSPLSTKLNLKRS